MKLSSCDVASEGCKQRGHLWAQLEKDLGWLWVGNFCPPA